MPFIALFAKPVLKFGLYAIGAKKGIKNMEQSPINDILEVKQFLVLVVKAGIESNKDGEWNSKDIPNLAPPLFALVPALEGIGDIGNELKVLDQHIDELVGTISSDLGIEPTSAIKVYVESGLEILKHTYKILKTAKAV